MDLSWDRAARDHLADRFHHRGEEPAGYIPGYGSSLDRGQCQSHVVLREGVWFERRWHGFLRIVCFSRIHDLPDCELAQRVSLVTRELENGSVLHFFDHCGVLWVLCITPPFSLRSRDISDDSE